MPSPLQKYNESHKERWTVLVDMPDWVLDSVSEVICKVLYVDLFRPRSSAIKTIQQKFRFILDEVIDMPLDAEGDFPNNLRNSFMQNDGKALLLLDIVTKYVRDYAPSATPYGDSTARDTEILKHIESLLLNGSKWQVVNERNAESGIIERVDTNVKELAVEIDEDQLTMAWNQAFKSQPNTEAAIDHAQKAIEIVASESGLTNLTSGVYGGIIGDIKANPEKYASSAMIEYSKHDEITKKDNEINRSFSVWFADSMDFIQKTNPARHKSKIVKDFKPSPKSAQQAVVLATILCWYIKNHYFYKIGNPE